MTPEGKIGRFEIKHRDGYCALYEGNREWTIDIPRLNQTQQFALDGCWGRVLVGGLGTGWIVEQLAKKPDVTKIIVVEIAQEVIDLVWPYLDTRGKGEVVCADLFDYLEQPRDVDTMYFDICNPGRGDERKFIPLLRKLAEKWLSPERIFCWEEHKCIA